MEPAGLTTLPVEVIQHMSRYLSVQDILSCSLTCHGLRAALNDDFVWKRYLKKDAARLEDQESQVSPHFCFQDDLMPLCKNRKHFMRQTHLVNNVKAGHFVKYTSGFVNSTTTSPHLFIPLKGRERLIYNDKYIFLGSLDNFGYHNGIEIWDLSKEPTYYTSLKIENTRLHGFYIVGSYLIITESLRVCVYKITLPEKVFPLLHSFFVTGKSVEENFILYRELSNLVYIKWDLAFVDNYMMSHQSEENILEIWDITNATKVGAVHPPIVSHSIELHSYTDNLCLFKLFPRDHLSPNYLVSFNLKNMQFCDRSIQYETNVADIIFHNSKIIILKKGNDFCCVICNVYDNNTFLHLKEKTFYGNVSKNARNISSNTVVNDTFVVIFHGCLNFIDALTLETLRIIKFDDDLAVSELIDIYGEIFSVIARRIAGWKLELWDISRTGQLFSGLNEIYYKYHIFLDSHCSKIVLVSSYDISVVHLW